MILNKTFTFNHSKILKPAHDLLADKRNFQTKIFTDIKSEIIEYIPRGDGIIPRSAKFYSSTRDTETRLPLVIYLVGGGGDWETSGKQWCDNEWATRGYISACVETGDVGGGFSPEKVIEELINLRAFIGYCKANHGKLRINGNKIISTGTSFGGILSASYNAAMVRLIYSALDPIFRSPISEFYKKTSPFIFASAALPGSCDATYRAMITEASVPHYGFNGDKDITTPVESAIKTDRAFQEAGVDSILRIFEGATHKLENLHDTICQDMVNHFATLMGIPLVVKPVET